MTIPTTALRQGESKHIKISKPREGRTPLEQEVFRLRAFNAMQKLAAKQDEMATHEILIAAGYAATRASNGDGNVKDLERWLREQAKKKLDAVIQLVKKPPITGPGKNNPCVWRLLRVDFSSEMTLPLWESGR